jgi:hypothetical protein
MKAHPEALEAHFEAVKAHYLDIVTYPGALEYWRMIMEQKMLTPGAMESYSVAMATHSGSAGGTPCTVVMKKILELL